MELDAVFSARFETRDVDELVEALAPVAPGVSIAPTAGPRFQVACELARSPRVGLLSIQPADMRVLDAPPRSYYSASIALEGRFEVFEGTRQGEYSLGASHILDRQRPFDLRAHAGLRCFVVNIDAGLVEKHIRGWAGRDDADGANVLLRTDRGAGGRFAALARELFQTLRGETSVRLTELAMAETEERLAEFLVRAWLGNAWTGAAEPASPCVERAEEYLAAKVAEPVSIADVAQAAGTSVRTLSRGFRSKHGVGPMRFLRLRRLEAVHRCLVMTEPEGDSVTNAALHHGFAHLGRFSAEYRRHFGELPSETLARRARSNRSAREFTRLAARHATP